MTQLALVILMVGALGCGPIGPLSGGRLSGALGPIETQDWSPHAGDKTLQLETRPEDPHSVNTWFAAMGPRLYVPTSMILGPKNPAERSWVRNVGEDSRVRLRLGKLVYQRVATRVEDVAEYDAARSALEQKYEIDPEERDPEREIWIFRMDPRAP